MLYLVVTAQLYVVHRERELEPPPGVPQETVRAGHVPGEVKYLEQPCADYTKAILGAVEGIAHGPPGDVLVSARTRRERGSAALGIRLLLCKLSFQVVLRYIVFRVFTGAVVCSTFRACA